MFFCKYRLNRKTFNRIAVITHEQCIVSIDVHQTMQQNAGLEHWSFAEVDSRLREVMKRIHDECRHQAEAHGIPGDYVAGANIGGFLRVAQAMMEQGVV